jgi:flagellar motor switch protein FliN
MIKKKEKEPEAPVSEDIEAFEEWEDLSGGEVSEDSREMPEEPLPEPPKQAEKPKPARPAKIETPPKSAKIESPMTDEVMHMSADVPVHLVAVIGRTTASVKDLMNYQMGQVIDLGRPPGETVDLVASGKLFARGELVDIDGKLGVRIVKLIK